MKRIRFEIIAFAISAYFVGFPSSGLTENLDISWMKVFGGFYADEGRSIQKTNDGGYIIAGYTKEDAASGINIFLIKTDSHGQIIWDNMYGGPNDDWGNYVELTDDGGYIIAGGTESFSENNNDVYLVKTDSDGNIIWQKTYGGEFDEEASCVMQTWDGGYILVGWTDSYGAGEDDVYLIKTNAWGDTLWTRTFGDAFYDKGYMVEQTSDSHLIIIGGTGYFGFYNPDAYLIKIDLNGDTLWTRTVGDYWSDAGRSITKTPDGGFIIAGWTMSYGEGSHDIYLVKVDSTGESVYHKTYGGEYSDVARSLEPTSDGGYIITGYTYSFGEGNMDIYVIKTDSNCDSIWTTTIGGPEFDYGWAGVESRDGGYTVVGWTSSFGAHSRDIILANISFQQTDADDIIDINTPDKFALFQNYPNPFNAATTISFAVEDDHQVILAIYDLLGREVNCLIDEFLTAGSYQVSFDASHLASGVYLCSLQADDNRQTKRMVLLK